MAITMKYQGEAMAIIAATSGAATAAKSTAAAAATYVNICTDI